MIKIIYFLVFLPITGFSQAKDFPILKGPYLGQKPPRMLPEIFAPDIISTDQDLHSCPAFSPDGKSLFWRIMNAGEKNGIYYMELEENQWTLPQKAAFGEIENNITYDVPVFSVENDLFFTSDREFNGTRKKRIWFNTKTNGIWGKPICFEEFNPEDISLHWQFTFSNKGNIYFTGMMDNGFGKYDIFVAKKRGDKYSYEIYPEPINSSDSDICPYIAPDESYLIFASANRQNGYGKCDLYVCFKNENDDSWDDPINLGSEINSEQHDWCPMVTQDGKYLFFTSFRNGRCNAYWVNANIIENLNPDRIKQRQ